MTNLIEYLKSFVRILNHPLNRQYKVKAAIRILWWKINQLFFHMPAVLILHNTEVKIICPPWSSYGSLVVYCNLPEYPEMKFLEKIIKQNSIFIDVGANIGVYTLLAAAKIKKGKIYSFEPVPKALDTLYQNIQINSLQDKVTVVEKVASDKTGEERFKNFDISEYSHISSNQASDTIKIPAVKLDDFCKTKKIDRVDLIKIDVEGAEMKVLRGLEKYLVSGKVKHLIVELNERNRFFGESSNQIIEYLRNLNFRVYRLDKENNLEELKQVDETKTLNVIAILDS